MSAQSKAPPAPRGREINLIVVHCAATPNGKPFTVEDIDRWHAARGWQRNPYFRKLQNSTLAAIGYHFVLYVNGACARRVVCAHAR